MNLLQYSVIPVSLLLGGCGTTGAIVDSLRPDPVIVRPVVPADCRLDPVEPEPLAEPELPPLPARPGANATAVQALPYYTIRTQRAEAAGLYFQGVVERERFARVTNADNQRACAAWARSQGEPPQ